MVYCLGATNNNFSGGGGIMVKKSVRDMPASIYSPAQSGDFVEWSNTLNIWRTTGYSLSFWFKIANGNSGNQVLFSQGDASSSNTLFEILQGVSNPLTIQVFLRNSSGTTLLNVVSTTKIGDGWNHLCWTDNNGTATLYINGVADASDFSYTPSWIVTGKHLDGQRV